MLILVPYTEAYLDCSWDWLNDPETKRLTMTPDFTKQDQRQFFESLRTRANYKIWGVQLDGRPVGAAGVKNIGETRGEYWGYLGEKRLWGKGLGRSMLELVENKARELGLNEIYLRVSHDNLRAIRLYEKCGYQLIADGNSIEMTKCLLR